MRTSVGVPPENGCAERSSRAWAKSRPSALGEAAAQRLLHLRPGTALAAAAAAGGAPGAPRRLRQGVAEERLVLGEHLGDVGRPHATLEAVHQRVVRVEPKRRRQRRRGLAHQPHDLLEMRAHHARNPMPARLAPDLLAGGVGARLRLDQIGRQRGRAGIGVAHQAQIGRAPGIGLAGGLRLGEIVADFGADSSECDNPASTASWSPRAAPPPGGIIVAASQPSSETLRRSSRCGRNGRRGGHRRCWATWLGPTGEGGRRFCTPSG